jgi:predicted Zn-dependent peptidase
MPSLSRLSLLLASVSALAACATTAPRADVADAPSAVVAGPAAEAAPAPVSALVGEVKIPHERFQLDNGLTVIVHTDRKAPVVAVSTWYNVGSKDEPRGKTGFAHLFEHLMFNGSENLPGDYFTYLEQIGATDYNGTTWFDRTNYFQTVPTGAVDKALFMESDRMGYLLGAVTQAKLDNQRGVVQNEKRQGDNQPGGLLDYEILEALFPEGHPYRHDTIGSMADLDAASLEDVRNWFRDNYGPNNAVLVLAGDIDAATARPLVEKYFAAIPRGPVNEPAAADVPTLAAPKTIVQKDRVAATQIRRVWATGGLLHEDYEALNLGAKILGGLASSRLDNALVRDEKIAVSVSTSYQPFHRVGQFTVTAVAKPGVDAALVEKRVDEILADFVANGPTQEELTRASTDEVADIIRGLEQVGGFGGKAGTLAEGQLYEGNPASYAETLAKYASLTPADVRGAMGRWLSRPAVLVRLEPGDRAPYVEAKGAAAPKTRAAPVKITKREVPAVGQLAALDFPDVQRATLSNGIQVTYAQRGAVPVTQVAMAFDAGNAADTPTRRGLQNMALTLLDEGAGELSSRQIAEKMEELGAQIAVQPTPDLSIVRLSALSDNLQPSLGLMADVVQRPRFDTAEVERVRTQLLTQISQEQKDPNQIARRAAPALLYGPDHPYAAAGSGDPEAVKAISRDDLAAFQQSWLRPDNVSLFVVSDRPLAEITPQLEAQFGKWATPAAPKGTKQFTAPPARLAKPRVVLIDRPGSPQSIIRGVQLTPLDPKGDTLAATTANEVLAGSFLSRLNMDLRETKGWSYGAGGAFTLNREAAPFLVSAGVQADRTGDSLAAMDLQVRQFLTAKGVNDEELSRTVANSINGLPGSFETGEAVLQAMIDNALLGRPDTYQEELAARYRGLNQASLDQAARANIDPNAFIWVVVGDAAKVRPQLTKLGMQVEEMQPR